FLASPVITEVCVALPSAHHRARAHDLIRALRIRAPIAGDEAQLWHDVFAWLARYADHEPDWADAYLAVLCDRDRRLKVWTYDSDLWTMWGRPDGSRIPLAVKPA